MAVGVDEVAELPPTWTDEVAIVNDAPTAIAFSLSASNPCNQFSIGEEETGETYLDAAAGSDELSDLAARTGRPTD